MLSAFITQTLADHEISFVLTALVVATVMATTVMILARRAALLRGTERFRWGLLLALVAGTGVWTTHFVAVLGFRPDAILGYDPVITFLSAAAGVICVGGPLMASCYVRHRIVRAGLGALAGLGVGAMHFTGMSALVGCELVHDQTTNLVALGLGAGSFAAALALGAGRRRSVLVVALAVAGVCLLHFTALFGLTLTEIGDVTGRGIDGGAFSALVVFAALALTGAAAASIRAEARLEIQRRQASDMQARQEDVFMLALRNMSNGLIMVDAAGRVSAVNPRALEILGLEQGDVAPGVEATALLMAMAGKPEWDAAEVQEFVAEHRRWLAADQSTRTERRFANARVVSVICRPMPEGGSILTYDDVTEYRTAQDAMVHMAYHDPLTGLPNRRAFREEVQRLPMRDGGVSVLMLDLDRFKWVNDSLGHGIGDALLVQVADRLRRACQPADRIFRLGGDEIAIFSEDCCGIGARELAEAARAVFDSPFRIEGHTVSIGCSIGIACATLAGDRHALVEKADLALYRAKSLGRGRIESYESGMMERAIERRQIEADLVAALANGEFELHYQPLHALPERRLLGFEALIRWRHPSRGMVSPAEFVPIAEANGMILDIGTWVLNEACRQLAQWPSDLHVAINASAVQLRSSEFVGQVAEALERHGIAPQRLEVELTETAMVADGKQIARVLSELRKLGVRIAMDDFGTGYSSLAHLRDFELDRIKIDRSFVDTELGDVGSRAVIRALTSLARDLQIVTIGEGVETEEQLDRLVELGCDVAQGYLLGRPLDVAAASRLISIRLFDDDLADERREAMLPEGRKRA